MSSALRLWAFVTRDYKSHDLTYTTANPAIWSCVEASIAITSACLPSLKPFFTAMKSTYKKSRTKSSSLPLKSPSSGSPSRRVGLLPRSRQSDSSPHEPSDIERPKQARSDAKMWEAEHLESDMYPAASIPWTSVAL